jgi:hypothetical protein
MWMRVPSWPAPIADGHERSGSLVFGSGHMHSRAMGAQLERERAVYIAHEAEWAAAHPGRFVVVKGDSLLGTFESMEDALAAGAAAFGTESFLVRKLGERQSGWGTERNVTWAESTYGSVMLTGRPTLMKKRANACDKCSR